MFFKGGKFLVKLEDKNEYWSENFKGLDLFNKEFVSKEFDGCVFENCDFNEAIFKRCNFVDCEFINCNLSNVEMEYSKFSEVCFRESKLIGINWTKVTWSKLLLISPIKFYKTILNDSSFYGLSLQEQAAPDSIKQCGNIAAV